MADNKDKKVLKSSIERELSQTCLNSAEREKIKGSTNLNVPHLRFKEFQGKWEKYELGDICETITDFVAAGSFASLRENVKYYQEDNYAQLVRTVDLKKKFTNNDFVYVDEFAYDFLWRVQLKEPNIVLPNIGANIGEKYYVSPKDLPKEKNVLGPNAILLRSKCNDTHFVYFRLSTSSYDNEMKKLVGASGQPKFNKTDLKKVRLFIPSLKEQKKISYFLGLLEERIATQNKIIEDLKLLRSAITDYAVNSLDIDTVKFSSLYKIAGEGGTPSTSNVDFYKNGQIPFVKIDDLKQKYLTENKDFITELGLQKSSAWLVPTNSILFSNGATIGEISITTYPVCTKQGILGIVPKSHVDVEYLYYFMSSTYFRKEVCRIMTEGTMKTAYLKDINNIRCPIPTKETQQEIAKMPSLLNSKIELEQDILDTLNKQKQYLLRQMFI